MARCHMKFMSTKFLNQLLSPGLSVAMTSCWKRENGLKFYFNCHSSPDSSPIENCWQARVKNLGHFDSETTRELAREGWESISQEGLNKNVLSMPQRFRDCIQLEGELTGCGCCNFDVVRARCRLHGRQPNCISSFNKKENLYD